MMLRTKSVAALLGLAGMGAMPEAKAWIDIEFHQLGQPAMLFCHGANYKPACLNGIWNGEVWWNPLDGERWSRFRILSQGHWVNIAMFDLRHGCSVGWGTGRGWSWLVWASGDDGVWGSFTEVCSGGGGGTEKMQINVFPGPDGFRFDIRGKAPPGSRPCARYAYSKTKKSVTQLTCA